MVGGLQSGRVKALLLIDQIPHSLLFLFAARYLQWRLLPPARLNGGLEKSSLLTTIEVAEAERSGIGDQFPELSRHCNSSFLRGAHEGLPVQLIEVFLHSSSRDLIYTSSPWSGGVKHSLGHFLQQS